MKRILYAPEPTFTGTCCGVDFCDGVGVCEDDFTAGFLCAKGFATAPSGMAYGEQAPDVPAEAAPPVRPAANELAGMSLEELVTLAQALGVPLDGIRRGDRAGLIARLTAGE